MLWNSKKNNRIALLLLMFTCSSQVHSVSRKAVNRLTGCMALTYTAGVYGLYDKVGNDNALLYLVAAGVFVTGLTHRVLGYTTPERLLDKAEFLLKKLAAYKFVKITFKEEASFFDAVYDVYLMEDLPLIAAYKTLLELVSLSHTAHGFINQALACAKQDAFLQERCEALHYKSEKLHKNISQAIKRIRLHKDYLPQLRFYKQFVLKEKPFFALI